MDYAHLAKTVFQCAVLFLCGTALFDVVHYILHAFEKSRFRFFRWLGSFHTVHHEFLDKQMQIQKRYSMGNLILHVIPEYLTAVVGMGVIGLLFFGWLPTAIVIGIRTVMVVVYVFQRGEDFTHRPRARINGIRNLYFVGPHYHALHHVYPNQYYSSFINVFDIIFGTNCQIKGRRFLVTPSNSRFNASLVERLKKMGGEVQTLSPEEAAERLVVKEKLKTTDVLILSALKKNEASALERSEVIELFKEVSKQRLVPAEVWDVGKCSTPPFRSSTKDSYLFDNDITYRCISAGESAIHAGLTLFLIQRGMRRLP